MVGFLASIVAGLRWTKEWGIILCSRQCISKLGNVGHGQLKITGPFCWIRIQMSKFEGGCLSYSSVCLAQFLILLSLSISLVNNGRHYPVRPQMAALMNLTWHLRNVTCFMVTVN